MTGIVLIAIGAWTRRFWKEPHFFVNLERALWIVSQSVISHWRSHNERLLVRLFRTTKVNQPDMPEPDAAA
jgi:hypothetical protein